MASSVKVDLTADVPTLIVTGTGEKVFIQTGNIYLGGSTVDTTDGMFLSGFYADYYDLGVVAVGEELYALSPSVNNAVYVFTMDAT